MAKWKSFAKRQEKELFCLLGVQRVTLREVRDECRGGMPSIWLQTAALGVGRVSVHEGPGKTNIRKGVDGLVLEVQRWRSYMLGRKFVVNTDKRSLKFLFGAKSDTA